MKTKSLFGATPLALSPVALSVALALGLCGPAAPVHGQGAPLYTVAPDSAVGESALRNAVDALFDDGDMGDTRAVLVLHNGRVVAERYAPGFGPDTKLPAWSVAKSVTAVLIGLMVSDGRLALDAPAPMPAWNQAGDPRAAITLRHLLTMTSGLDHTETADPADGDVASTDAARMFYTDGAQDMAAYAEGKPLADKPGVTFTYSSANSAILSDLATRMLTESPDAEIRRAAMAQFIEGRLKLPVGLASLTPEYDAHGTMIGGSFLHMTARDQAKFGEFLRNRGRANGRQILSARWVDFMTHASPRNPAYGGHIWLNRAPDGASDSPLFPNQGPRSLFACVGDSGDYILIAPDRGLTVVRLGVSQGEEVVALRNGLARLVGLFG